MSNKKADTRNKDLKTKKPAKLEDHMQPTIETEEKPEVYSTVVESTAIKTVKNLKQKQYL